MKLTTSDIIQIIGIMIAIITGIASIIISVISLRQNSKIVKESNKAQIEIFPFKIYGDVVPRIKIQNFGSTTGTIIDVQVNPEIPTDDIIDNPFKYYQGLSLASNQSFITVFSKKSLSEVPLEKFDITIKYITLDELVTSTFHINYKFLEGTLETQSSSKDVNKALDKINQSIQGLQQK